MSIAEAETWLEMFNYMRSEMVRGLGVGRDVLLQAEALEPEVIEFFVVMDAHVSEVREEMRKQG